MPGKSRHGKGKRYHYSKKSKALRRQTSPGAPVAAINVSEATGQPAPAATPSLPKTSAVPAAQATENSYPYIGSELRRIAILAGIIIVILVVLSIILK
jgi:hypothetical protein